MRVAGGPLLDDPLQVLLLRLATWTLCLLLLQLDELSLLRLAAWTLSLLLLELVELSLLLLAAWTVPPLLLELFQLRLAAWALALTRFLLLLVTPQA